MTAKTISRMAWAATWAAVLAWGAGDARAEAVRGAINGWANLPWMATNVAFAGDTHYSATLTSTTTRASSGFKFDQSGDWVTQWGTGASATNAAVNGTIGHAHVNQGGNTPGNLTFAETSGMKYTFRLQGLASWWYRPYVIMATANHPVSISSVSDNSSVAATNAVTVTATLSAAPSGESVYARWTTNGFTNSALALASLSGTNATIAIPAQPTGRTVKYYVLTSTMPTDRITGDYDLCTLRANNSGGTNFSYLVGMADPVLGNSWHHPANAEPAGATMRNPPTNGVPPSTAIFFYNGTYTTESDQSGGTLYHRLQGALTWSTTNLAFDSQAGANKYWSTRIPGGTYAATNVVEYYMGITYSDDSPTFLGTTNNTASWAYAAATNAAAHPFSYVVGVPAAPVFGECWHNPQEMVQGTDVTMRNPTNPGAGRSVYVYAGNYQADSGGANMAGGVVWFRKGASGAWSSTNLSFNNEVRNGENTGAVKNWIAGLPTAGYVEGDALQYVVQADYGNRDTTFMGTTNQTGTVMYAALASAQSNAYACVFGALPPPVFGNGWHFPTNAEPAGATMRNPVNPTPSSATYIYGGNYQGDADMTGGWVFYKKSTAETWASNGLAWDSTSGGNNAYWKAAIPSNAVALGETLQYYLQLDYANGGADTTYLGTTTQADNVKYAQATNAAAHPFAATSAARLGNCWHVPTNAEPTGAYMRNPRHPYADNAVSIYTGNQAGGTGGNPGDQSGGTLFYRLQGAGTWSSAAMAFDAEIGYNKYWRGTIPANASNKTQTVEYVVATTYADHDTTYLGLASNSVASQPFATLEEAQAKPFGFTYGGDPGTEPGYVWHGGNAVKISGDSVQLWVKVGYKNGTNVWADRAEVRYAVGTTTRASSAKQGVRALPGRRAPDPALTRIAAMAFDHEEEDSSANGNAMWWVATIVDSNLAASASSVLRYQIAAWKSATNGGNGVARLAEYQADGVNDQVFEYRMQSAGANALTVNGQNADYTTTKFFIDEARGESAHVRAVYVPPTGATDVQIFSNVGRRDFWNADLDGNGVPDSIRPPSGDLITPTTAGYFAAHAMTWDAGAGAYVWEADIARCGAYRLTARYHAPGDTHWHYYSELGGGIRDHAVVISPKKVLQQSIYELNALSAKATNATENGRSTFAGLIDTREANRGTFDEFGIEYLNKIQANCLWFQPIHTSSEYGLGAGGEPGSPYSAKDYFAVSKWFGRGKTTASALGEFQQFVAACDAGKSSHMATSYVGTINIMLDGVFNHTSWDAVFGEMGEKMGLVPAGQGANTAIGSLRPGWFANYSDYGAPATFYHGPAGGQHDIASAPDRGDFGKWLDTAELFYGNYAALVRHNPDNNGDYLNEADWYDYSSMTTQTEELWKYMGAYPEFWLEKTGHSMSNRPGARDANGVLFDDYGIDGLRCDFGQGLPPQFWEYIVNRTRATKWNFMFMAESLDGGKVSYRSNRHFDILNESFVFQMVGAGSPGDVKNAVESRKNLYSGGAVLLNLTSHDEVMPYSDPWTTASRFAMVSSVMGLPMTFFGQEQGIIPCDANKTGKVPGDTVEGSAANGFAKFELNMGKWVPHFKNWNRLWVWDNPPSADWSRQMAQWYGRVNWARLNSPALQSGNQYFLGRKHEGTYDNGKIFAVAKCEEFGAVAKGKDAVLAFSLFVNVGEGGHAGANDTYDLTACWNLLGLTNSADVYYNARNLASSAASSTVWATNKSGAELYNDGIWVSFDSDGGGRKIYDDGAIVQYLKIERVDAPAAAPLQIAFLPASPIHVAYMELANFAVSVTGTNGLPVADVTTNLATSVPGSTFVAGQFSYAVTNTAWVGATNGVQFSASNSTASTSAWMNISVPVDSNSNHIPDIWERTYFDDYASAGPAAYDEYIANTDPTDPADYFHLTQIQVVETPARRTVVCNTAPDRAYRIEFTDDNLDANPVAWHGFQANGAWTNTAGDSTHAFTDDGTSNSSGVALGGRRVYRVRVGLP